MNNDTLKTFLTVAETKSFHKTAQQLFIAQSTVSARIQELEKELQQTLFDRKFKSPELTPAGQRLVPYAQRMLEMMESLRGEIAPEKKEAVPLTIGYSDSIFYSYIRQHMPQFVLKHPEIAPSLRSSNSLAMLNMLRDGRLDICISFQPGSEEDFHNYELSEERIVLATGIQNIEHTRGVTREELLELPLIYSECFNMNRELNRWRFELLPSTFPFRFRTDVVIQLGYMLEHTDCYAFVPHGFIREELHRHTLQEIPLLFDPPPPLKTYVTIRQEDEQRPEITAFLQETVFHSHPGE